MTKEKEIASKFLDPRADVVFKKIFGQHPELVKSFLNSVLPLPEGHLIEEVSYLPTEQSPRIPSMKNTIVDVKCTDETGRIFIVEMQMTWSQSFMKRFLFETSKAFVQQLGKGETYDALCPVYGLALVNKAFEKGTGEWFHHYRLTNVKDLGKTLEGMEMVFLELPKFNPQTFQDRKIGVLWLRFLRETYALEGIPEEFKESPEVVKAMELAQESAYTPAELAAYDEFLDTVRVEQTLRSDYLKEGEQIGLEKGERIGLEKGERKLAEERKKYEEELAEERKKSLEEKKQMINIMISEGSSLEFIQKITGLDIKTIQSLQT